jgi:hypothetical protein
MASKLWWVLQYIRFASPLASLSVSIDLVIAFTQLSVVFPAYIIPGLASIVLYGFT